MREGGGRQKQPIAPHSYTAFQNSAASADLPLYMPIMLYILVILFVISYFTAAYFFELLYFFYVF